MNAEKSSQKILLVDDESAITENLTPLLGWAGYEVSVAINGSDALDKVKKINPDMVVMDVLMPVMDGRQTLRILREQNNWVPVILLTQVGESTERAMALEEGADDYLNKPFDPHELVARIRTVLRRAKSGKPPLSSSWKLQSGPLILDRRARRVTLAEEEINLTPKAMLLLEYLMTHPDELINRDRLLEVVWGWEYPVGARAVDTRIAELRRILDDDPSEPKYIETIPGQGYRFSKDVQGLE